MKANFIQSYIKNLNNQALFKVYIKKSNQIRYEKSRKNFNELKTRQTTAWREKADV